MIEAEEEEKQKKKKRNIKRTKENPQYNIPINQKNIFKDTVYNYIH